MRNLLDFLIFKPRAIYHALRAYVVAVVSRPT
jgi:hypothetical protein